MQSQLLSESAFTRRFMLSMAMFLVLLGVQTFAIELAELSSLSLVLVTLMPMAPLLWAFFIYRARFRSLDEYMQRLTGEAFLWVIGIVSFASFAYGMLAMKMPMPEVSFAFILPVVFGGHGLVFQLLLRESGSEE